MMILDLVKISDYGLEGKNRYWVNAERFNLTHDDLRSIGVEDDEAYLNKATCEKLKQIDDELLQQGLHLIVKDAYRWKELYDLVYRKRVEKLWKEETDKIFNTKNDYPHSTGDTLDVTIVHADTKEPLKFYKWDIQDRADLVASWATNFYENAQDEEWKVIHANRTTLQNIMTKYGFEGIPHEYWHFNLKK